MSPTVFREGRFRFFFFSREETRMHIPVRAAECEAKFWMAPEISLAENQGFSASDVRIIESLVKEHADEIREAWQRHFGG